MDLRNFEKQINKQFESYQPNTDGDQIWANIKDHIPAETKDRKPPFFYKFLLSILPLVAFVVFCIGSVNSKHSKDIATASIVAQLNSKISTENVTPEPVQSETVLSDSENNTTQTLFEKVNAQAPVNNPTSIEISTQSQNDSPVVKKNNVAISAVAKKTSSIVSNSFMKNNNNNFQNKKTQIQQASFLSDNLPKSNLNKTQVTISSPLKIQLLSPGLLPIFNRDLILIPSNLAEHNVLKKQGRRVSHHLGISAGFFLAKVNYQSQTNSELLALRQDSEQAFEMIQLGIDYQYDLSKKWSVASGLNLWKYNWQSLHTVVNEEVIENMFSTVSRQTKTTHKRINADSGLSIPFMINYNTSISGRLNWQMGVGYEYNIKGWHTGFESELNSQEYDINADLTNQYKDKAGNYFLAQAGINFPLFQKTKLQFSVSTKLGSDDFQSSNAAVRKSYIFYGFNLGIQKNIN